jgi:GINS complex subunit 4
VEELKREGVEDVVVSLHHMDADRALFLLKSYLRLRLRKIQKHLFFYHSHSPSWAHLSPPEQRFCRRCFISLLHSIPFFFFIYS